MMFDTAHELFRIDTFSMVMSALVVFMTVAVSIYSPGYCEERTTFRRAVFYGAPWLFCLFSCLGVVSGSWFMFTISVELSSLALFFIILLQDPKAARLYIFSQLLGAGFLLTGTALLGALTGATAIGPVPGDILWLFLTGLGFKAAFPVLHFWLPQVHGKAPTPASALLSGFAVKIGVFGIARLVSPDTGTVLPFLGSLMAIYGVGQALLQHDAKRLLAYHTVSQLGYIVTALGAGTSLGIAAGFFHTVAHALFKGLLFLSVGTLEKVYGTKDLDHLGGAARELPLTFSLFLVGALAISGFPGFSGYASKAMVKAALYEIPNPLWYWALQAAGVGTVISFCKVGYFAFIRERDPGLRPHREHMPGGRKDLMRNTGMALPAAATLTLGIFPGFFAGLGGLESNSLFGMKDLLPAAATFALGISLFWILRKWFGSGKHEIPDIDTLISKGSRLSAPVFSILQSMNCGLLRFYIVAVVAAGLALMFLM